MAKISANIGSSKARRLMTLRQKYIWTERELESLESLIQKEKETKLSRFVKSENKKIEKDAFAACDKAAYYDEIIAKKLVKYDKKAYLSQRAANHGAAKEIFAAVRAGKSYDAALKKQEEKIAQIAAKRKDYVDELNAKKAQFIASNPTVDGSGYAAKKSAVDAKIASKEQALTAACASKLTARKAKLERKLSSINSQIKSVKSSKKNLGIPEDVVLRVKGLKMYFGGLKAVDDLTFDVKKGEIFGLIGPNGAGKTTVFNCITRFYDATGGEMYFTNKFGDTVNLRNFQVHDVIMHGIVRTFQNVEVIREVSVLENLLIAGHRQYSSSLAAQALHLPILKREEEAIRERAMKVLEFMGLTSYKDWYAFGLPYGVLKKIEIARTLMCNPQLIILDEPAAGLNDTETAELAQLIRRIQKEYDCTILLVEHDMGLVMDICDTVCAISFGKLLAIGTTDEVQANKDVQAAYLGSSEEG